MNSSLCLCMGLLLYLLKCLYVKPWVFSLLPCLFSPPSHQVGAASGCVVLSCWLGLNHDTGICNVWSPHHITQQREKEHVTGKPANKFDFAVQGQTPKLEETLSKPDCSRDSDINPTTLRVTKNSWGRRINSDFSVNLWVTDFSDLCESVYTE